MPVEIRLQNCAQLPDSMARMLDRYAQVLAPLPARTRLAARFHEHMLRTYPAGVLESPCGAGKSTWALCHIAATASPANRYLYVLETVAGVHRAADVLEKLTEMPVGCVHSFNQDYCFQLCGKQHTWRECSPADTRSVCSECAENTTCAYYTRAEQEKKPILCVTHSGLMRMLEEESALLTDSSILVDEGLNPFSTCEVTRGALDNLERHAGNVVLGLGRLFPYSSVAYRSELEQWQLNGADVFASRNYVFRDEQQTAALAAAYSDMQKLQAIGVHALAEDAFKNAGAAERARETLGQLLAFFRPAKAGDATYAFREMHETAGMRYVLKRRRFQLDTGRQHRRLWILNASAMLSPDPYPANMPVYTCPDLPDNSGLLTLHVASGNPTRTRQQQNIILSHVALHLEARFQPHKAILIATDKSGDALEELTKQVHSLFKDPAVQIVHMSRGSIKGRNDAGHCTLAILTGMATFTTVDDCALHAALLLRRTFPDRPLVYDAAGRPNMPGGRLAVPAMQQYFALRSLDELYQAVYRAAVRNDQPTEALVALPDPEWLIALWRTVLPNAKIGSAYKAYKPKAGEQFDFEEDELFTGLNIVQAPPGAEFSKAQVAEQLGYTQWENNKLRIMGLIDDFFEEGSTIRKLRRKTSALRAAHAGAENAGATTNVGAPG